MPVQQFKLPDLGEGLTEGDILKWTVAVGDTVEVNDTIAEVETVKAAVELPVAVRRHGHRAARRRGDDRPGRHADHLDRHRWRDTAAENAAAGEDMVPDGARRGRHRGEAADAGRLRPARGDRTAPPPASGQRLGRAGSAAGAQVSFNLPPGAAPGPDAEPRSRSRAPAAGPGAGQAAGAQARQDPRRRPRRRPRRPARTAPSPATTSRPPPDSGQIRARVVSRN